MTEDQEVESVLLAEPATEVMVEEPKSAPKPKSKPKAKAKAKAKVKASAKPKLKAKAKTAKGSEKAKAAKSSVEKDQYGLRKGSTKSQAAAIYARKSGATLEEVKEKLGSVQLNVLNELEEDGWKVERVKEQRKDRRPATRYWLKAKS